MSLMDPVPERCDRSLKQIYNRYFDTHFLFPLLPHPYPPHPTSSRYPISTQANSLLTNCELFSRFDWSKVQDKSTPPPFIPFTTTSTSNKGGDRDEGIGPNPPRRVSKGSGSTFEQWSQRQQQEQALGDSVDLFVEDEKPSPLRYNGDQAIFSGFQCVLGTTVVQVEDSLCVVLISRPASSDEELIQPHFIRNKE